MLTGHDILAFSLASRGAQFDDATYYTTYRNVRLSFPSANMAIVATWADCTVLDVQQVILSITGIPGAFLAGWAVELPWFGRRGTLAISAGEYSSLLSHPSLPLFFIAAFLFSPSLPLLLPCRLFDSVFSGDCRCVIADYSTTPVRTSRANGGLPLCEHHRAQLRRAARVELRVCV